jgi:hypothetical protein
VELELRMTPMTRRFLSVCIRVIGGYTSERCDEAGRHGEFGREWAGEFGAMNVLIAEPDAGANRRSATAFHAGWKFGRACCAPPSLPAPVVQLERSAAVRASR